MCVQFRNLNLSASFKSPSIHSSPSPDLLNFLRVFFLFFPTSFSRPCFMFFIWLSNGLTSCIYFIFVSHTLCTLRAFCRIAGPPPPHCLRCAEDSELWLLRLHVTFSSFPSLSYSPLSMVHETYQLHISVRQNFFHDPCCWPTM